MTHARPVDDPATSRRPIKARASRAAAFGARALASHGLTPNLISTAGIFFSGLGAGAMLFSHSYGWALAALMIQARLLCNLLDGMVAVEHGKGSPDGALFNEFPDRVEDSLFLIAAGYACGHAEIGLYAALFAALTAYVRAFGASAGQPQDFGGPMAKPHRMALLTCACLGMALGAPPQLMQGALFAIAAGAAITCALRTRRIRARMLAAAPLGRQP